MTAALAGLYSSPSTCDVVAKREMREISRRTGMPTLSLIEHVEPLIKRIGRGRKIQRGELTPMLFRLRKRLSDLENVIGADIRTDVPTISVDEQHTIRVVYHGSDGENGEIFYSSTKITVTRTEIQVFYDDLGFDVIPHVLSRYMQRERKPVQTFHEEILRAMQAMLPLGVAAVQHDTDTMALPFASGLILADVRRIPCYASGFKMEFSRGSFDEHAGNARRCILKTARLGIRAMTYVSGADLFDGKRELRQELEDFERLYAAEMAAMFSQHAWHDGIKNTEAVRTMLREAIKLSNGPAWQKMLHHRRTRLMSA